MKRLFIIALTLLIGIATYSQGNKKTDSLLNKIDLKYKGARLKTGYHGPDTTTIDKWICSEPYKFDTLRPANVRPLKDSVERQLVDNPLKALESSMHCLFISDGPPTPKKVRIQSVNSLSFAKGPLYVINGCIVQSLSPSSAKFLFADFDVSSIDILKDTVATAIYGSRAADGAILITLKRKLIKGREYDNFRFDNHCWIFSDFPPYLHKRRTRAGYFIRLKFKKAFK